MDRRKDSTNQPGLLHLIDSGSRLLAGGPSTSPHDLLCPWSFYLLGRRHENTRPLVRELPPGGGPFHVGGSRVPGPNTFLIEMFIDPCHRHSTPIHEKSIYRVEWLTTWTVENFEIDTVVLTGVVLMQRDATGNTCRVEFKGWRQVMSTVLSTVFLGYI